MERQGMACLYNSVKHDDVAEVEGKKLDKRHGIVIFDIW